MKHPSPLVLLVACLFGCSKHNDKAASVAPPPPSKTPVLQTNAVTNLTHFSVNLSGKILSSSGEAISEFGFVIDTASEPTTAKNLFKLQVQQTDSAGDFVLNVDELPSLTTYYVRAYAIDSAGAGYGNTVKFSSLLSKVYEGDVTLSTQQQVIDFGSNHYTIIDGNMTINGSVTDLTPLIGLSAVNYTFTASNSALVNFKGLDSLELTGALYANGFFVEYNANLINFTGLGRLKQSNGETQIDFNPALQSLDGLDSYIAANYGDLRITDCASLQNLNGLKKMLGVSEDFYLDNNPALTDISGLSMVSTVNGRIYILNDASLPSLHGLEGIHSLDGGLDIESNASLSDLSALSNLTSIAGANEPGALTLTGNPMIKDLSVFKHLPYVSYLTIDNNTGLTSLSGLSNLSYAGVVEFVGDSNLKDLTGLTALTKVSRLTITDNPSLVNLHGLDGVTTILDNEYSITMARNNSLVSLDGLENLTSAPGTIQIFSNPVLTDFCPLKLLFTTGYTNWFYTQYNGSNPTQDQVVANCQ